MDFSASDDQQSLRELARKILEELLPQERHREIKATDDRIDRQLWNELAKASLLGVPVAEEHGGSGLGLEELCLLLEEVGRAVAPVPVYSTLVLGALPLAAFGSVDQQSEWLPRIASGDAILTACLAEAHEAEPTARREGEGWRLDGTHVAVPAAHLADRILFPASTEHGPALFLVDPSADGVEIVKAEATDEQFWCEVRLSGANVPESSLLGDPKQGAAQLAWLRDRAVLGLCALQVGVSSRALEMTAEYTTERRQFDRPIGSFQAVHQRAGDAFVDLQAMKLTLARSIHVLGHDEAAGDLLAIAKYWAAEGGARITYAAQHLHGGIGIDRDYPLHRYYIWARQIGIHLGAGSEQLARIGAELAA